MPVHRILVERNQDVVLVAHTAHGTIAGTDGQKSVTATNDGLIRIVGIQVQTAPGKNACENVAGTRDALAVFSSDADCEIHSSHEPILSSITPTKPVNKGT